MSVGEILAVIAAVTASATSIIGALKANGASNNTQHTRDLVSDKVPHISDVVDDMQKTLKNGHS